MQHALDLAMETGIFIDVAVPLPIPGPFTYRVPLDWKDQVKIGVRVRVPFKNREIIGYLVEICTQAPEGRIKSIIQILDQEPVLSHEILCLTRWIGEYYGSSWGESIENAIPKWVKYGKKAERALKKEAANTEPSGAGAVPQMPAFKLTKEQSGALDKICRAFDEDKAKPILLFGVTGSGKSEIYIRALRQILDRGKTAICLVPEIALTEQLRRFFLGHFGNDLEIVHSKLSDGERFLAWKRLERGERRIVLGPRSAIFAPLPKLGLIIMDEEHENSYKQETAPRYHARDVAAWRAMNQGAVFIMGTATPSLETMHRADSGKVMRIDLLKRIDDRPLPAVKIVDLKTSGARRSMLSTALALEIERNLKNREGTMLLLNRRGYSTNINCQHCGHMESCKACHVSLTFHQEDDFLLCHYCNFRKAVPKVCSNCKHEVPRFGGFGTEKVESEVARQFPGARISRMDTDSVRRKGSHEGILKDFRDQKIDILIGTQMIAKGFDFPHVTLVGVVLADVGLALPDFRSSERTFQLMTQVAGRAGRGTQPGRVFIQTYSPDHPSIICSQTHDYLRFYESEKGDRHAFNYPPYCRLINIILRSKKENDCYQYGLTLRDELRKAFGINNEEAGIQIVGPAPLPFFKLRGHFRWHIMLKANTQDSLTQPLNACISQVKKPSSVQLAVDVDPLNIL